MKTYLTLNNGIRIPNIGIGPGIVGYNPSALSLIHI